MKGHLENEKSSWITFIVIFASYTIVSMTKNTYSTAIATIVQEGLFTKANAGVINAGFYLLYSVAQLFGGVLIEKVPPFKMLIVGLAGALVTNVVMAVSNSYMVMLIAWTLNGLLQFGVWPVILKLTTTIVMPEHRQKSMSYLFFAYPLGGALSYLLAGVLLRFFSWPSLFWSSVITLGIMLLSVLWLMAYLNKKMVPGPEILPIELGDNKPEKAQAASPKSMSFFPMLFASGLIFLTVPALIRCMLDIGLKNWVPTMIMESYGVSPSFANLLTTVLIIVNLAGLFFVNWLYPKRCKSLTNAMGILFAACLPLLLLIVFTGKVHLFLVVIALALTTTFMTSFSQLINVIMPAAFSTQGKTGMIASFINSFGGLGVMLANYAYGLLADHFGWTITAVIWLILGIIAVIFSFMATPLWKRFTAENNA
ncbi:MAG: MFS transporter [Clostridia bacterium]|nr:MFS transporter [Clostridia bacterium]